ncbi:mitochondrial distribution and morphology protein 10 [Leptodontidium sp. MPI-SDFR-AT-0119]|nr:mitochondrial distribution and morphology protein 10 [Leptodontidium sp. MPI-SDFR-AT-0119]
MKTCTHLIAITRALLEFDTPRGLHLNLSVLSSPNFVTSGAIGSVGLVDGLLSGKIELQDVIRGYKQIQELRKPMEKRINKRNTLLYERLYLLQSTLEALYLRRLSPTQQLKLSAISDSRLRNGGTILALHYFDVGKYNTNRVKEVTNLPRTNDHFYSRFSTRADSHSNPLMGNLSTAYTVKAGKNLALCIKFDFNVYSYESGVMLGCELWKMKAKIPKERKRNILAKLEWRLDPVKENPVPKPDEVAGMIKDLLFTLGSSIDMKRRD